MDVASPVRVVIIDDKPTHLMSIANGLTVAGIPCVWHWYNNETNTLTPPAPEGGYPYLRMIITDLNIRNMGGANSAPQNLAGTLISEVLQPILAKESGPYSLLLWTSVGQSAAQVGPFIMDRINSGANANDRRPPPLAIEVMAKGDFIGTANDDLETSLEALLSETTQRSSQLRDVIIAASSTSNMLCLSSAWESRATLAAMGTINSVYKAAIHEAESVQESISDSLQKVYSKIAVEALGKNAKTEPARALDEGLIDLFVDDLRSSESDANYTAIVESALSAKLNAKPVSLSSRARSFLNTCLHIEFPINPKPKIDRGVALTMPVNQFEEFTDTGIGGYIWENFLHPLSLWAKQKQALVDAGLADTAIIDQKITFCKQNMDAAVAGCKPIILEIGADCDHAQRNQRTVRFLWALEVPIEFATLIGSLEDSQKLKNDALMKLGPWKVDDKEVYLLVSVKRFAIQQKWEVINGMVARYRLRKPLIDWVLHRYSSYSTRPGIINITE